MTAIVGVLNRQGVAFAADSAATHSKTHKITNHANKIFSISKYHPVGVALYNTLAFMGVPWETIIKSFRQRLNDTSFDTMQGYIDAFWTYLKTDVIVRWPEIQQANLTGFAQGYYKQITEEAKSDVGGTIDTNNTEPFFTALLQKMSIYQNAYQIRNTCDDLRNYTDVDITNYIQTNIDSLLNPLQKMDVR